jgi:Ras-related protein Rab-6A
LDFHSKNITNENTSIRLLLYDTAGQEKFKSLIPMYIRDANIIIIVYDITSNYKKIMLFNQTIPWLSECKDLKREDAIFCLVGNKLDLIEKRSVSVEEAEAFAREKDLIFREVSAKSGLNVNNLFYKDILDQLARKFNLGGMGEFQQNEDNIKDNTNRSI